MARAGLIAQGLDPGQHATVAQANRTASNITGWRNLMLQKNGTGAMRSSLNGEALTDHEAPGTALNATGLSIGGSSNNGVPAIEVEKVLFLQSGVLTADQMADVARLMA